MSMRAWGLALLLGALIGCVEDAKPPAAETETDAGLAADATLSPDAAADQGVEDEGPPPTIDAGLNVDLPCETVADCPDDSYTCTDGLCAPPECTEGGDECGMLQGCLAGGCVDRCFGEGTCFRGGLCIDGLCHPPECGGDADCGDGRLCRNDRCVDAEPCAGVEDCGADQQCVEGNCEPLPACGGDRNCGPEAICDEGLCRPRTGCESRDACEPSEDCVGGRCVPFVCRGDGDCAEGEICNGGECQQPAEVEVATVVVLNGPRALTVGQGLRYRAVGLDLRGDIVETRGFTWAVADGAVADIDGQGQLTAVAAGQTTVTAALGDVISEPVAVSVEALPVAEGWRVRVTSQGSGGAVAGAQVRAGMAVATTDEAGVAELPGDAGGPLTVFAEGHDYVSLVGVEPGAVHVPLPVRSDFARVAGFTGELDFARVMSEGGVELGLAGASIGGGLTNLSLTDLIGQLFNVEVGVAGFNFDVPLPGGLIFSAELPIVGRVTLKDDFKVTARPGFQLGWAFAGRIDTNAIIQLFGGGGGGFDAGTVLATVLPFFDQFQHGLRVSADLVALPRLPDQDDIDRDGDTAELVPDYSRFPVLNNQPEQDQRLRLSVNVPPLPGGDGSPVALLFAGVEVESVGFVPLGVSSTDAAEAVPMRMAAPYAGLEAGEPVVVAIAARFGGGNVLPDDISVLMRRFPGGLLPADVDLGAGFLATAEGLTWDPAERALSALEVAGADAHRAVFEGPSGAWHVYFAAGSEPAFDVPFPPEGYSDLAAGTLVRVDALTLEGATVSELATEGGAGDLTDVDRFATGFSRAAQ